MFFDPLYFIITLPALIFAFYAQWKVKSTFDKYSRVPSPGGLAGDAVAQILLRQNQLTDVRIARIPGELTDNYDPTQKVLNLSDSSVAAPSIAALGVVAHECGHAIQDKVGYAPLRIRGKLVPAVNFGSNAGIWLFFIGYFIHVFALAWIGVALFGLATVFALVPLPV